MEPISAFIGGGIFTLAILIIGNVIGYIVGSKKLEEKVEDIKRRFIVPPKVSGAVKAIKPEEIKEEQQKDFISKMRGIIDDGEN